MVRIGDLFDVELEKLDLREGNLCVLSYPDNASVEQIKKWSKELRDWLDVHQRRGVMFVAMPASFRLRELDPQLMAEHGWQRVSTET